MQASREQISFGDSLLLSDVDVAVPAGIRRTPIQPLRSAANYSHFMLRELADHIRTEHVLVVQWDGFVLDAAQWTDAFLDCDYIGAPWPQFSDDRKVGNGGFSLRSRRLLRACQDERFEAEHPEDVAIGRLNRTFLEHQGCRFADDALAESFSFERTVPSQPTFGFHGAFNLIPLVGPDAFWRIYNMLDHRGPIRRDACLLQRQLGNQPQHWGWRLRLAADALLSNVGRR
jgi:hypothetical protein